jgi:hypothetical protein
VRTAYRYAARRDRLIFIPITGDAQNDTGGRILRLAAPSVRETYDADLLRFRDEAKKQFTAWVESLSPLQRQTDILGSLDTARQELSALPQGGNRRLIVVSDFLEDEGSYRFVSSPALAAPGHARQLALRLRGEHGFSLHGVPACLGRLESSDFASLTPERKEAVKTFWTMYLMDADQRPEIRIDGTGMLTTLDQTCFAGKP